GGNDVPKLEEAILVAQFNESFKKLPAEEQKKMQEAILSAERAAGMSAGQLGSLGTLGALTAAQLSGFGMYVMAYLRNRKTNELSGTTNDINRLEREAEQLNREFL